MKRSRRPPALGYRWPAEWEPHRATWLSWPHNPETWPTALPEVEATFAQFVRALAPHEAVEIGLADDAMEARARAAIRAAGHDPDRNVGFHHYPTTDAWCRDHGPIFVVKPDGSRALCDFGFDNWGKKYPGWELDDAVPRHVEKILGLPRFPADVVLEGGGIEGDGQGTVITTESCLLNPNRGPGRTREIGCRSCSPTTSAPSTSSGCTTASKATTPTATSTTSCASSRPASSSPSPATTRATPTTPRSPRIASASIGCHRRHRPRSSP